jgi:hypothetical protein
MADGHPSAAVSGGNPLDIDDLLNFREAALHVVERADIGAIELVLLDRGQTVSTAVLAPVQALTVASRIVTSVLRVVAAGGAASGR